MVCLPRRFRGNADWVVVVMVTRCLLKKLIIVFHIFPQKWVSHFAFDNIIFI